MKRAFLLGAAIGLFVFLQGLLILRLPVRIHALELWALAWTGVFGLTLGSIFHDTAELATSLTLAGVGIVVFYGLSAVVLRVGYRSFRRVGLIAAAVGLLIIHVGIYLVVLRSVVA